METWHKNSHQWSCGEHGCWILNGIWNLSPAKLSMASWRPQLWLFVLKILKVNIFNTKQITANPNIVTNDQVHNPCISPLHVNVNGIRTDSVNYSYVPLTLFLHISENPNAELKGGRQVWWEGVVPVPVLGLYLSLLLLLLLLLLVLPSSPSTKPAMPVASETACSTAVAYR